MQDTTTMTIKMVDDESDDVSSASAIEDPPEAKPDEDVSGSGGNGIASV